MLWTLKIKCGKVIYTLQCLDVRDCEIPLRIGGRTVISLQTLCGFLMNVQRLQLSSSTESGWEQGCFRGALQCCIRSNGRTVQSEIQTSHKIYALSCREMKCWIVWWCFLGFWGEHSYCMGRFCKSFLFVIFWFYNCHHLRQDLHFSGGDTSTNVTHLQAPGIITHIKKFLCVLRQSGHIKLWTRKF